MRATFNTCLLIAELTAGVVRAHPGFHSEIEVTTERIAADPRNAALYLNRAELYRFHGDWEAALADLARASELDPSSAGIDLARAKVMQDAGSLTSAKVLLDRFIEAHPDHAEALATRARTLVALGRHRAAAEDFSRAISLLSRPPPEYFLERAGALVESGSRLQQAIAGLDEGVQKLGPAVALELYAIELELKRRRYRHALVRLDQIAARSHRKETWLARRGEILADAGRLSEARAAYHQALAAIEALPEGTRHTRATFELEGRLKAALALPTISKHERAMR